MTPEEINAQQIKAREAANAGPRPRHTGRALRPASASLDGRIDRPKE
ncbi:MAG: hypothetical protein M0R74_09120 [Dehalococcoidia bacterium]|jgi:hypothetical protein|nr:hypothetical protein [Dehalococcoidia bacterium]